MYGRALFLLCPKECCVFLFAALKGAESKLLGTVVTMSSELSHIQAQRVSSSGKTFDSQQFMRRVAAFMGM